MSLAETQSVVLDWYAANRRDLAFRHTTDPWAILVSEVMAQQTQAVRAADAWTRFMTRFPGPAALAAASPATVIRAWRGLGYNRRALSLRRAAIAIVEEHGGQVPDTLDALLALPGIGAYTARAVLAIAFDQPVAALDVNIRRVLGRAFIGPGAPDLSPPALQARADRLVPVSASAAWTHALMDIGASLCRPREPRCELCPLRTTCLYRAQPTALVGERAGRRPTAPMRFELTSRWLRGRILDRLRDAPEGAWVTFDDGIGVHESAAVGAAVERLAAEGMVEAVGRRARLGPG